MALVAGALGIVVLIVGLVAQAQRPEDTVEAVAQVDTAVVVVPADMVAFALASDGRVAVEGAGTLEAFTARPSDLDAWLDDKESTYLTGLPTWEELTTDVAAAAPEPSPTASPTPSAEPSPEPSTSPEAEGEQFDPLLDTSDDLWRDNWTGHGRVSVGAAQVPVGLDLVVVSADGSPLTSAELRLERDINDAWVMPLIVWGAILTAVGLVAVLLLLIDVRPLQARGEEWLARRQRIGTGDSGAKPGSRRARRMEGAAVPAVDLPEEPDAAGARDVENDAGSEPAQYGPGDDAGDESDAQDGSDAEEDETATREAVDPYAPRPEDEEGGR